MSTDERPPKRSRPDDEEEDSKPAIERSSDFWLDDGNIILQVESTQFRVLKSVLAKHSTVLRDMLLLPLPQDEPLIEGCPVVVLSGDTAQQWESMLQVMFPSICFEQKPSISEIAAILRLSKKYDMPIFRAECTRRLKVEFPSTLDAYLKVSGTWTCIVRRHEECISEVIASAKEVGLHSILPAAFYRLSQYLVNTKGCLKRSPKLAPSDQVDFLKGCMRMSHLHAESAPLKWLHTDPATVPAADCSRPQKCTERALSLRSSIPPGQCSTVLFKPWQTEWSRDLCKACVKAGQAVVNDTRHELWARLPSFFDLPDWEELERMDLDLIQ
ncbi:BTB domain-containing protein [Mycena kentingensis (nom. inval.)]|nr:BTB domain-containing protein [Mycena kentingensis (nom. inval.)]